MSDLRAWINTAMLKGLYLDSPAEFPSTAPVKTVLKNCMCSVCGQFNKNIDAFMCSKISDGFAET